MPRACVIVLDAVGAGELPDADRVRRRRIGHARQRRAGRRWARPTESRGARSRQRRAARGLPAATRRACSRGPAVRALEGQGHDDRPLGAHGDRHRAGVSDLSARLPARRYRPVHAQDRPRRAREQGRVRNGDHPGAGRGAPANREVDRLHLRGLRLPDRRARGHDPAGGAVRRLPGRARDPDREARRRTRHRQAVHGRAGKLRADAEPARLLARAAPAELPVPRCARPGRRSTASARSATSSPGRTSTSRSRRSRTSRASR